MELVYSLGASDFFLGELLPLGRATKHWHTLFIPTSLKNKIYTEANQQILCFPKMKIHIFSAKREFGNLLLKEPEKLFISADGKGKIKGSLPLNIGDVRENGILPLYHKVKLAWRDPKIKKELAYHLQALQ